MKNKEKYAKEIIEIAKIGHIVAVDKKNNPKDCNGFKCEECRLNVGYTDETGTRCNTSRKKWFEEEAPKDIYEVIEERIAQIKRSGCQVVTKEDVINLLESIATYRSEV